MARSGGERLKVLVCNWLSSRGGEERHVMDLLAYLAAHPGVDLFVAAPRRSAWSAELDALPSTTLLDVAFSTKFDFGSVLRLVKLLRHHRFDVVHVHGGRAGWLVRLAALLARYRNVIWSMHLFIEDHVSVVPAWARPPYYVVERLLNRRTARIIAVSEDLRRKLLRSDPILDPSRVITIENGIPEPAPRPYALAVASRPPVVCVAVGRLWPEKGHDILIRALAILPSSVRPLSLIAGEGPMRERLVALARAEGVEDRVRLLGFEANVLGLVAAAEVYVMPSRHEGLPIALLEAMALGKPIVASAVNGIPEAVEDGESGLLVPAGDPAALADALRRVLEDESLRHRLGRSARETYLRRFTAKRCFDRIFRAYEDLLASG